MLEQSGSIEGFFLEGYRDEHEDVGPALDSFSTRALALDIRRAYGRVPRRPGVCYFFPRPSAGSACKRLNLFLRWMVRSDEVDLGAWTKVPASKLIVPLDTHVIRLGRCLRLTRYVSPGWKMAADITRSLRRLDPDDPVRFDFSLCHVGMMNACGFGRKQGDSQCPLRGLCRPRVRARTPLRAAVAIVALVAAAAIGYVAGLRIGAVHELLFATPTEARRVAFVREEPCADRTCQTLWLGNTRDDAVQVGVAHAGHRTVRRDCVGQGRPPRRLRHQRLSAAHLRRLHEEAGAKRQPD